MKHKFFNKPYLVVSTVVYPEIGEVFVCPDPDVTVNGKKMWMVALMLQGDFVFRFGLFYRPDTARLFANRLHMQDVELWQELIATENILDDKNAEAQN